MRFFVGGKDGLGAAVVDVEEFGGLPDGHVLEDDFFEEELFDVGGESGVAGPGGVGGGLLVGEVGLVVGGLGLHGV